MYAFANRDVSVGVKFTINGDYTIPDAGSVTYTVYDKTGTAYADLTNQDGPSGTTGSILVPAAKNVVTDDIEYRWVIVNWQSDGTAYQDTYAYKLIPFIPLDVPANRVRSLLGVNQTEVLDTEVDPIEVYFLSDSTVKTALSEGGMNAWIANEILAHETALSLIPSLQLRVAQSVKTQNAEFSRLGTIDFQALEGHLINQIASLNAKLTGVEEVTPVFAVASTQTDPVTNS